MNNGNQQTIQRSNELLGKGGQGLVNLSGDEQEKEKGSYTIYAADGADYQGNWSEDKKNGLVAFQDANVRVYKGTLANDEIDVFATPNHTVSLP